MGLELYDEAALRAGESIRLLTDESLVVRRDERFSAHQSIYRVGQLVFRLVDSVFRLHGITGAVLVNRERLFFGLDPFAGGIKDGSFGIGHGPILAAPEIGVGTVEDVFVPLCPNTGRN
jgi:hypothetical protein